jgi:hypothetical protein
MPSPSVIPAVLLLTLAASLPMSLRAAEPAGCDWRERALPADADLIDSRGLGLEERLLPIDDQPEGAELLALLERPPLPLGDLQGRWRVRSLQFSRMSGDAGQVFAYPFFNALIDRNPCGYHLAKTSGSQRRSGQLYPLQGEPMLAFLGAATINAQTPADYDPQRPAESQAPGDGNSAGVLRRIGDDELLLVLDATGDDFEVYHLKR